MSPIRCEWYALCDRPADGYAPHPVLGAVPCCDECAEKHELKLEPLIEPTPKKRARGGRAQRRVIARRL